jgi:hypothetical protein
MNMSDEPPNVPEGQDEHGQLTIPRALAQRDLINLNSAPTVDWANKRLEEVWNRAKAIRPADPEWQCVIGDANYVTKDDSVGDLGQED